MKNQRWIKLSRQVAVMREEDVVYRQLYIHSSSYLDLKINIHNKLIMVAILILVSIQKKKIIAHYLIMHLSMYKAIVQVYFWKPMRNNHTSIIMKSTKVQTVVKIRPNKIIMGDLHRAHHQIMIIRRNHNMRNHNNFLMWDHRTEIMLIITKKP